VGRIKDEHYQFLIEYFPVSKLHDRYEALWADSVRVIENTGLEELHCYENVMAERDIETGILHW
jgi:hypothetical protein